MRVLVRRKQNALSVLTNREYGSPSPLWTSCLILRLSMFGPNRKWALVGKDKSNCVVEFNYDLQWVTSDNNISGGPCSQMKRIHTNGLYQVLYELPNIQRIRLIYIYDLPHPVYKSSIPQHEYRPAVLALRKPNILTRHDMERGKRYNEIHLGKVVMKNLSWNSSLDQLILSSSKYKNSLHEVTIAFKIFVLHPLSHLVSIAISANVFPAAEDKAKYGQLRNAEIDGSFLLVMTMKSYTLIYSAEDIIKPIVRSATDAMESSAVPIDIDAAPPLLFAVSAHMDILSFGGSPWMYVKSVSDGVLEVRYLGSSDLIEGGRVSFEEAEQKITPDYLTFHMDDTNRLIHAKNSDLRVLCIENSNGKSTLRQEFQYSKQQALKNQNAVQSTCTTRFGRKVQMKVFDDPSMNRALAFGLESDLNIFFILEMQREMTGIELSKITFYDNNTYVVLHERPLNLQVFGDIEENNVSVFMEKDILSIVTRKNSLFTHFVFRLTYDQDDVAEKAEKQLRSPARSFSLRKRNTLSRIEPVRRRASFELSHSNSDEEDGDWEQEWRP